MKRCLVVIPQETGFLPVLATCNWRGQWQCRVVEDASGCPNAEVIGILPAGSSLVRTLTVALPSLWKARKVWPSLLDVQLPFPLESCRSHFSREKRVASGWGTTAVVARKETLAELAEQYVAGGWQLEGFDQEALALWSGLLAEGPAVADGQGIAYFGTDHSVFVWGVAGVLTGSFSSAVGSGNWTEEAGTKLLGRLNSVAASWLAVGPGLGLKDKLPLKWLAGPVIEPELFLARAVARRWAAGELANLGEMSAANQERARRRSIRWAQGLVAVAVVAMSLQWGWQQYLDRQIGIWQGELTRLAKIVTGLSQVPRGQELLLAQRALAEGAGARQELRKLINPSLTFLLQAVMHVALENNLRLTSLSLSFDQISLSGWAPTKEAIERVNKALQAYAAKVDLSGLMELPEAR